MKLHMHTACSSAAGGSDGPFQRRLSVQWCLSLEYAWQGDTAATDVADIMAEMQYCVHVEC